MQREAVLALGQCLGARTASCQTEGRRSPRWRTQKPASFDCHWPTTMDGSCSSAPRPRTQRRHTRGVLIFGAEVFNYFTGYYSSNKRSVSLIGIILINKNSFENDVDTIFSSQLWQTTCNLPYCTCTGYSLFETDSAAVHVPRTREATQLTQLLQGYHAETPSGASHSHLSFRHLASTQPHRAAMPMAAARRRPKGRVHVHVIV
jgi:hypothetical protein